MFRHNGAPFREEEIAHLIYYGSSKHDPESSDPIGKFGSGFLTTHMLSKNVSVSGAMYDGRRFSFILSREGGTPRELARAMDDSWEEFKASLGSRASEAAPSFTEYAYPLRGESTAFAAAGLQELEKLAPYTLAFNPKLCEIAIETPAKRVRWRVQDVRPTTTDANVALIPIRMECDEGDLDQLVAKASSANVDVTVLTISDAGTPRVLLESSSPRLFVAFPLFGTASFPFPAVINCERFRVPEHRNGIYLGPDNTDAIRENKALIEEASDLYIALLSAGAAAGWFDLQKLALLPDFTSHTWLDEEWYREVLRKAIERARSVRMIKSNDGDLRASKQSRIPLSQLNVSVDDVWSLSSKLTQVSDALPLREDAGPWSLVIEGWASMLSRQAHDLEESWTLQKIASWLGGLGTLGALRSALNEETNAIGWLNTFYGLLKNAEMLTLFDNLSLLPNQAGEFKTRSALFVDAGISEVLKDAAEKLGVRARAELLHAGIELTLIPKLLQKSEEELLKLVVQTVISKAETARGPAREANSELFRFLLERQEFAKLETFPCFSRNEGVEDQHVIRISSKLEDVNQIPLAPVDLWPEGVKQFLQLLPEKWIISDEYLIANQREHWSKLAALKFVRLDPLFDAEDKAIDLVPVHALPEPLDTHRISSEVRFSGISFFSTKNIGLIDRARGSQIRARQLLHFLVEYILNKDPTAIEQVSVPCDCGNSHTYYRAEWLKHLRDRMWVPIGEKQHASAEAESLAKLLANEPDFLRELAQGEAGKMMDALGVGRSDLLLCSSTQSEDERIDLVVSALDLSAAVGNDTARLKAITTAIRNDPRVMADIEEASARRARVKKNQAVGTEVERLLRELLEAPEVGLKVTRKPFGQDFEVENDILQDDGTEVLFEIEGGRRPSFLIEVKASTREEFRMTPRQAETAVRERGRFLLCAVNLFDNTNITTDQVRTGSRFVPDIGTLLQALWGDFSMFEVVRAGTPKKMGDVELEIDDSKARFKVGINTWNAGMPFDLAVEYIRSAATSAG